MKIAIVGCGLIGNKRAMALQKFPDCRLEGVYDIDSEKAGKFAKIFACSPIPNLDDLLTNAEIDTIIVSTINKFLVPISIKALNSGKNVLCEKPPGLNLEETRHLYQSALKSKGKIKIGFNHRHHPAIRRAKDLVVSGAIGEISYIRSRYGHGGRPGYEKEWRADISLSGGGELFDQGIHLLDLFHWFMGDFSQIFGYTPSYFWKPPFEQVAGELNIWEDNAFALLKTDAGQVASLHASCTQWKNLFSFEIFGKDGYLIIEGLGGSYGIETLKIGKRRPESGPPDEQLIEFPNVDISWEEEWREFMASIRDDRQPLGSIHDGLMAMRLVDAIYLSSRENKMVTIQKD